MPLTYYETVRNKLRALKGTNKVSDIDAGLEALANDVDTKMVSWWEGTHAARPAAGQPNRLYRETDTGLLFHDTGAAWENIPIGATPRYITTGGPIGGSGTEISGSTVTINTPANTLVSWRAQIHGQATAGTPGYYTVRLWRDGVNILTHTIELGANNAGNQTTTEMLEWIQTTSGSHEWKITIEWGGTGFAGTVNGGILAFMP